MLHNKLQHASCKKLKTCPLTQRDWHEDNRFVPEFNIGSISTSTVLTHWSDTWKSKYSWYYLSKNEIETEQNGRGAKDQFHRKTNSTSSSSAEEEEVESFFLISFDV